MVNFCIRVAGCTAAVSALYESTRLFCSGFLCADAPDFAVEITPADIDFERAQTLREAQVEGRNPPAFPDAYLETTAVQRKIAEELFGRNVMLFHGSVVAVDGAAYLFTAKSGTGKSTHTGFWRRVFGERAVMINDDKPFLRIEEDRILACGSPWNGKHRLGCDASASLRAICILERGAENHICRIDAKDAVFMLLQQSNRPLRREMTPKYMDLIDRLAARVDFYRMACNLDPQAALVAYEAMAGEGKDV